MSTPSVLWTENRDTSCRPRESLSGSPVALQERIKRAIELATGNQVRGLQVQTEPDCVVLIGRCNWYYQKKVAQDVAIMLAGAAELSNRIDVESDHDSSAD